MGKRLIWKLVCCNSFIHSFIGTHILLSSSSCFRFLSSSSLLFLSSSICSWIFLSRSCSSSIFCCSTRFSTSFSCLFNFPTRSKYNASTASRFISVFYSVNRNEIRSVLKPLVFSDSPLLFSKNRIGGYQVAVDKHPGVTQ